MSSGWSPLWRNMPMAVPILAHSPVALKDGKPAFHDPDAPLRVVHYARLSRGASSAR